MTTTPHLLEASSVTRTVLSPVDSLTDALTTERRLLDELIVVMRRQRTAVGQDDLQAVDDSVFSTHRVLVTLSDVRLTVTSAEVLVRWENETTTPKWS